LTEGGIVTEEYSRYYRIAFDLHKKYAPCPGDLETWQAAAQEFAAISAQNGNNPFLMEMLGAVYSEMERQHRRQQP